VRRSGEIICKHLRCGQTLAYRSHGARGFPAFARPPHGRRAVPSPLRAKIASLTPTSKDRSLPPQEAEFASWGPRSLGTPSHHPNEQRSLAGDPESPGTPVSLKAGFELPGKLPISRLPRNKFRSFTSCLAKASCTLLSTNPCCQKSAPLDCGPRNWNVHLFPAFPGCI